MINTQAWLLDIFEDLQYPGLVLWFLTTDGQRLRLTQPFSVTFYLAGKSAELREAWKFLKEQPAQPKLSRQSKKDIFLAEDIHVLAVEVNSPGLLLRLFRAVLNRFPEFNLL